MSNDFYVELADERLDEVIRLRAENEKLRAALKPFAKAYPENEARMHEWTTGVTGVFLSELRAAAAALKEMGDE